MVTLVSQSFGNETEYRRAILSIWSFFAVCSGQARTLLFTDNPDFFKMYFTGCEVQYVLLRSETIERMRGEINFLHRMKIEIIDEAFRMSKDNLLYADSDTFFTDDPAPLMATLSENVAFMHVREHTFKSLQELPLPSGEVFHNFFDLIRSRRFELASGSSIQVHEHQYSWNAGVMMLHHAVENLLPDVYTLTEVFYPATRNHASEQYAFSIVLQNRVTLKACESVVYHYWHRVKKQIVDNFLHEELRGQWATLPFESKAPTIKAWVKKFPAKFERHILTLRYNAIQEFCQNNFSRGYYFTLKALMKDPFETKFLRDILYHTKRLILFKR